MDIDRYAELDDALPERNVTFVIEVDAVRVAVDERAKEAKVLDAPLQLVASRSHVLHGEVCEPSVSVRMLLDRRASLNPPDTVWSPVSSLPLLARSFSCPWNPLRVPFFDDSG